MIADIREQQPHVVINTGDSVHVIAIADLRRLANGETYRGEQAEMIQVLAKALVDVID